MTEPKRSESDRPKNDSSSESSRQNSKPTRDTLDSEEKSKLQMPG